ncbi:MAG: linear amide C-N hydrolase [Chloroflexi bacterium]|nr:linear amide C-N hydrolase [Chloroflexota bacterium]
MKRNLFVLLLMLALLGGGLALQRSGWLEPLRSLASLRQVDGFPLYVMRYYGDYGFDQYLRTGRRPDASTLLEQAYAWACTCFAARDPAGGLVFGRNFDWTTQAALLLFADPPHGYASVSVVDITYLGFGQGRPSWSDRQQLLKAPYLPFDGVNEEGLVVEMMAVDAVPGRDPQKMTIGSLEAIRLLLDYAANVDEALALLRQYSIDFGSGPGLHYMIADATGHSVVVEFVRGEMVVLYNEEAWQVSTNFLLSVVRPRGATSPCGRYNMVWSALRVAEGRLLAEEAMSLLQAAAQSSGPSPTQWSVVYDTAGQRVLLAMGRRYERVHEFEWKVGR